jgi:uncharacterized protein YkwD
MNQVIKFKKFSLFMVLAFLILSVIGCSNQNETFLPPDVQSLKNLMLDLINADRTEAGVSPVIWDDMAELVGQNHTEDMADNGFFSHWNMAGEGPDHRYGAIGGLDTTFENIHTFWYRFDDGSPVPIDDWEAVVREAEIGLMNSPGHRRNILDPAHTHVGVGIAYNPELGQFWLAQEFVNHYIRLQPLPQKMSLGSTYTLQGELLPMAHSPLINLAYSPFLKPMSKAELANTDTYASSAEFFEAINPTLNNDGTFTADLTFYNEGKPGLYHVRVWVSVNNQTENVIASDVIVEVQ